MADLELFWIAVSVDADRHSDLLILQFDLLTFFIYYKQKTVHYKLLYKISYLKNIFLAF